MTKEITRNDLKLASLKMLASVYNITGEKDISETLIWAVERIEELEAQRKACAHCCNSEPRKWVGKVANVLPFKRD